MNSNLIVIAYVVFTSIALSDGQCVCDLQNSATYPHTLKWNCQTRGLTYVPIECFDTQSENVTELILTDNRISLISKGEFSLLTDLRALHIDYNFITSIDAGCLDGVDGLEYFNVGQNTQLKSFPATLFDGKTNMQKLYFVSSPIGILPPVTESHVMDTIDARSSGLTTLPRPMLSKSLAGTTFLFNAIGNSVVDVAADIILPIPDGGTIFFDSTVIIWATDMVQKYDVINKNWNINVNLDTNLLVCDYDGNPKDPTMC